MVTDQLSADRVAAASLLDGALALAPEAGARSPQADTDLRVADEVVEALVQAGFCRHLVPVRWGGVPGSYAELTAAVAVVGEACASAAWLASLLAYTARFAAYLPLEGQAEVWAQGPDTRIVSSFVGEAQGIPAPGGWLVSGKWRYASGVQHSDWALVMIPGTGDGEDLVAAVPRREYDIENTWSAIGMRGTGSHSLRLPEAFVPSTRTFPMKNLIAGTQAVSRERRHAMPLFAVNGLTFGAPILGAARGALARVARRLERAEQSQLVTFARAAAEIDAAQLLLDRIARAADEGTPEAPAVARGRRDAALTAELLTAAVDRLFTAAGTAGQAMHDPLQQIWRDVHCAASHFVLRFEPAAVAYAAGFRPSPGMDAKRR
jgi:two-component flavin-dependent monooxygenase